MRVAIVHETIYRYEHPAHYSVQYLRLTPRSYGRQKVISWRLETPGLARAWTDAFGNDAHVLVVERPHTEIRVRLERGGGRRRTGTPRRSGAAESGSVLAIDAAHDGRPFARGFAADHGRNSATDRKACLDELMRAIRDRMDYRRGATDVETQASEAFSRGAGYVKTTRTSSSRARATSVSPRAT